MSRPDGGAPAVKLPGWLLRCRPSARNSHLFECVCLAMGLETMRHAANLFVAMDPDSGRRLAFHGSTAPSTSRMARVLAQDRELLLVRLRAAGLPVPAFRSFQAGEVGAIRRFAATLEYPLWMQPHPAGLRWRRGEHLQDRASLADALANVSEAPLEKGRPMVRGRVVVGAVPRGQGKVLVVTEQQERALLVRCSGHRAAVDDVEELHPGFHRLARQALAALPGAVFGSVEMVAEDFRADPDGQARIVQVSMLPRLLAGRKSWNEAWRVARIVVANELPDPAGRDVDAVGGLKRVFKARGVADPAVFVEAMTAAAAACGVRVTGADASGADLEFRVEGRATRLARLSMMLATNQSAQEYLPDTLEFSGAAFKAG